jgi:uncharacterized protein (TIGR02147 family)
MSPQMLSFVLNKKKSISPETGIKVANRLNLDPEETSHFLDLVMLAHARSSGPIKKLIAFRIEERTKAQNSQFKTLDIEAFKAIADWHHHAILELTFTETFKSDPKWIAARLGTTPFEVSQAIDRLERLELLERDKSGKIRKTDVNISISASYNVPSAALRKLSKGLLEKAIDSLETQSIHERDITNITMAIDPALLPEAKQMIADFRRKLCSFLEQGERTEVYTFSPALFKISNPVKGKNQS